MSALIADPSPNVAATSYGSAWTRASLLLALAFVTVPIFYWRTVVTLIAAWQQPPYSHGYVVFPAALYFAWRRRSQLERTAPTGSPVGLAFVGILAFGWLMGELSNTDVVRHFCVVALFIALTWAAVGTGAARVLMMPLGLLLFAVPVGDRLVPTLQDFTAHFAALMLDLTGIPVLLEGHIVTVPGSRWEVATLCSGVSYLFSSTAVGFVYAALNYRSWILRAAFFSASAIVPLIANGLRVYTVILIAGLGATGVASGIEHYLYGSVFFLMIMALLFAVAGRWVDRSEDRVTSPRDTSDASAPRRGGRRTAAFAIAACVIAAAVPISSGLLWAAPVTTPQVRSTLPIVSPPWSAGADTFDWAPTFVEPLAQAMQTYRSDNEHVKLFAAFFSTEQAGVKLATVSNLLYNHGWQELGQRRVPAVVDGQAFNVHETVVRSPRSSVVVWNWYAVDGQLTGNDFWARALLARARLLRRSTEATAVAIAVEGEPSADAERTLRNFIAHTSFLPLVSSR